jgi:hypothetical protein
LRLPSLLIVKCVYRWPSSIGTFARTTVVWQMFIGRSR